MRALSESSAAIAILSQNMEESEVAKQELSLLLERLRSGDIRATAVFPVRIDDSELPPELKKFQWVDLRNEGAEARLIRGMASAISPY